MLNQVEIVQHIAQWCPRYKVFNITGLVESLQKLMCFIHISYFYPHVVFVFFKDSRSINTYKALINSNIQLLVSNVLITSNGHYQSHSDSKSLHRLSLTKWLSSLISEKECNLCLKPMTQNNFCQCCGETWCLDCSSKISRCPFCKYDLWNQKKKVEI